MASITAGLLLAASVPFLLIFLFMGYLLFVTMAGRNAGMGWDVRFGPIALLMATAFLSGFSWRYARLIRR